MPAHSLMTVMPRQSRTLRVPLQYSLSATAILTKRWENRPGVSGEEATTQSSVPSSIYVSIANGSDHNPGTKARPLRSINRAAAVALNNYVSGVSTVVYIAPGVYRESITLFGFDKPEGATISFEGDPNGQTVISGSSIWADWVPTGESGIYKHSWPYKWGQCSVPSGWPRLSEIILHREMLFVNGSLMTQVLSKDAMLPNSFYVDEGASVIYIEPASHIDIARATVEISTIPSLLFVNQISHLSIHNLTFEHANSCLQESAAAGVRIQNGSHINIVSSSFDWNNWIGLALMNLADVKIKSITADHNGELGVNGYRLRNLLMQDINTSYNDWRGLWGNFDTWEAGGSKFLHTHGGILSIYKAVQNGGRGIWLDTDNEEVTISDALIAHNTQDGVFLEKNEGPLTITGSTLCDNAAGIRTNSALVSLLNNVVTDNIQSQIYVDGSEGNPVVRNSETSARYKISATGFVLQHGTYSSFGSGLLMLVQLPARNDAIEFLGSIKSDYNTWTFTSNTAAFRWKVADVSTAGDINWWRTFTRQDLESTFTVGAHPHTCPGDQQ